MSSSTKPQTWLVTGSSSGFGLWLVRTILARGHNVIATSRNPARTPDHVKEIESTPRGKWLALDVSTDAATIRATMQEAQKMFGKIDVLINNAGYSVLGSAEEIPEEKAKAQFEVNLWGAIRVTQAALPIMRAQRSGTVVMISSIAGIHAIPSCAIYAASKFGLEAWSEAMSQEVAPLGIRVLIVEPGAFRTNFAGSNAMQLVPISDDYRGGPLDVVLQKFNTMDGTQTGDATKAAERIVMNVERGLDKNDLGKIEKLRLPLGQDCYDRITTKMGWLNENWSSVKDEALNLQIDE